MTINTVYIDFCTASRAYTAKRALDIRNSLNHINATTRFSKTRNSQLVIEYHVEDTEEVMQIIANPERALEDAKEHQENMAS